MDFKSLRQDYNGEELHRSDLSDDPFEQFDTWYQQAIDAGVELPDAMSLATCGEQANPTVRTVVLRGHSREGFRFFTNLNSRKARQLLDQPTASLLFYWQPFHRQVRIEGDAQQIPRPEVEEYFSTRPRNSQLAAHVSDQSQSVSNREELEEKFEEVRTQFEGTEVPCPENWGGFLLKPNCFFFWQGRKNRLHDRFRYLPDGSTWTLERIAP